MSEWCWTNRNKLLRRGHWKTKTITVLLLCRGSNMLCFFNSNRYSLQLSLVWELRGFLSSVSSDQDYLINYQTHQIKALWSRDGANKIKSPQKGMQAWDQKCVFCSIYNSKSFSTDLFVYRFGFGLAFLVTLLSTFCVKWWQDQGAQCVTNTLSNLQF